MTHLSQLSLQAQHVLIELDFTLFFEDEIMFLVTYLQTSKQSKTHPRWG